MTIPGPVCGLQGALKSPSRCGWWLTPSPQLGSSPPQARSALPSVPATQPPESAPHLSPPRPKAPHAQDLSLHHFHPIAGYGASTEGTPGVLGGAPQKQVLGPRTPERDIY